MLSYLVSLKGEPAGETQAKSVCGVVVLPLLTWRRNEPACRHGGLEGLLT